MKDKYTTMFALPVLLLALVAGAVQADDKAMIDANTDRALTWLRASDIEHAQLLEQAAGVLVFPDVVEMGFGVGGQFGEGALLVKGEPVQYYATAGKEFGMGAEADYKAEVIFFMTEEALENFRASHSWKVGDSGNVPVLNHPSVTVRSSAAEPVVGVIFSEDGLAPGLHLQGNKITRIAR